jgi:UDP-N-acetylglucosamine 2-epimerase (non-hydrolysing)
MIKVMTIVGTRPEIIKMSRVISLFDRHTRHLLVHTGQNYDFELSEVFFRDLEIRPPDLFLEAAGGKAISTIAQVIEKSDAALERERPDAVLIYGDTNSCLSAIAVKRRKIPLFHMEAGNRCFDQNVPEENNRKIVDHLSDVNIVLSEHARRHLLSEGLPPDRVIKSGSHMKEVIQYYRKKIDASDIRAQLGLAKEGYFLVSAHREENVDSDHQLRELIAALGALIETYKLPVIVSTHPRTRQRIEAMDGVPVKDGIRFLKPFSFTDYVRLQIDAFCILSDSGTITEEASLLNLPAITIRNTHERPEGMDEGVLLMSPIDSGRILEAVRLVAETHQRSDGRLTPVVSDYDVEQVSHKILRIVFSYTDYVNRVVWSAPIRPHS